MQQGPFDEAFEIGALQAELSSRAGLDAVNLTRCKLLLCLLDGLTDCLRLSSRNSCSYRGNVHRQQDPAKCVGNCRSTHEVKQPLDQSLQDFDGMLQR